MEAFISVRRSLVTIGGTAAGAGNLISGNNVIGVHVYLSDASTMWSRATSSGPTLRGAGDRQRRGHRDLRRRLEQHGRGSTTTPGTGAGNVISGNTDDGVQFTVQNTDSGPTGNLVAGNLSAPIRRVRSRGQRRRRRLDREGSSGNLIGGTTAAARNVISANGYSGVRIAVANDNLVEGNFIGTDKTGTVGLGNLGSGVYGTALGGVQIDSGSAGNTIGGLTATPGTGAGNVISDNGFAGVLLNDAGSNNLIAGNLIGTDATGTVALGNLFDPVENGGGVGVYVSYSPDTTVGEPGGATPSRATAQVLATAATLVCWAHPAAWSRATLSAPTSLEPSHSPTKHLKASTSKTGRTRSADLRRLRGRDWGT